MPRKTKPAAAPEAAAPADPFRITTDLLHEWRACAGGVAEFTRHFPEGGAYADVIDRAYDTKQYSYARWLAGAAWTAWIEKPGFLAAEITTSDEMVARLTALAESDLTSSGYVAQIGSSGYVARIGSSGYAARIDATGENAIVAIAGFGSTVVLGAGGCAAVPYHDGARTRFAVAYVGENVEAGKRYSVNNLGEFVEAV